jgi:putative membrane protein
LELDVRFILRWFITALAVAAAAYLVPGIHASGDNGFLVVAIMALALGFANAVIRPVLAFLSCGCIILTLGIFMVVVNAVTFYLAAWLTNIFLPEAFVVDSLWSALLGSIVVSVVSFALSMLLTDSES